MEVSGLDLFNFGLVRESCWKTCDEDSGSYPINLNKVPNYRDEETREEFMDLVTVFGCFDLCDEEHKQQLTAVILYICAAVLAVLIIVIIAMSCYFCQCCYCYKCRRSNKTKHLMSSTSSSLDLPPNQAGLESTSSSAQSWIKAMVMPSSSAEAAKDKNSNFAKLRRRISRETARRHPRPERLESVSTISSNDLDFEPQRRRQRNLMNHESERKLDLSASMKSDISVNSWVDEKKNKRRNAALRSRKESLMKTATNLGKKLAQLDQRSDKRKSRQMSKSRQYHSDNDTTPSGENVRGRRSKSYDRSRHHESRRKKRNDRDGSRRY